MAKAKQGDTVKVHYTGKFPTGDIFDSSEGRDPLQFTIGSGQVIKGFDIGATGLEVEESKVVEIAAADAYGEFRQDMIFEIARDQVPADVNPQAGQQLQMQNDQGHVINVIVKDINDEKIVLDANHPLAGKDLVFDIKLVEIV